MKVDVVFTGDKDIQTFLREVPDKLNVQITTGVIKKTLNELTIPMAKSMASKVRDKGVLQENIKAWVHKKGVMAGVFIKSRKVRSKFNKGDLLKALGAGGVKQFKRMEWQKEPYYAYWIEHGHKDRGGNWIPPRPFWRPAWNATKDQVIKKSEDRFWDHIEKYAKRKGWM